jgi:hypothetical protein
MPVGQDNPGADLGYLRVSTNVLAIFSLDFWVGAFSFEDEMALFQLLSNWAISLSIVLSWGSSTKIPDVLRGFSKPISLVVLSDDMQPARNINTEREKQMSIRKVK